MANWEFEGGEAKSGLMGLLAMSQSQYGLETGIDNQYVVIDADNGALYWYGNRGDGTVELLAAIDTSYTAYPDTIATFGTYNSIYNAIVGLSKSGFGIVGSSINNSAVVGQSENYEGGYFWSKNGFGVYAETESYDAYYSGLACIGGFGGGPALKVWGSAVISGDCSATSFTDTTPYYIGDALSDIKNIKGKGKHLDHSTLPDFARRTATVVDYILDEKGRPKKDVNKKPIFDKPRVEERRDIGAMVSILTVGMQQLTQRVEALEKK